MSGWTANETLAGVIYFLVWVGLMAFTYLCWKAGRMQ